MSASMAAPGIRLKRISWRPRFAGGAAFMGLLGGVGGLVQQQQAGKIYPTATAAAVAVLGGVVVSQVMVNLGSIVAVVRANRKVAHAERVMGGRMARVPAATPRPAAAGWHATHAVPAAGLDAWDGPDPAAPPVAALDPGLEVQLLAEDGGWAHVLCSNGWSTWTDSRALVALRR